MEANYQIWNDERKQKRWDYWKAVNEARQDYLEEFKGVYDLTVRPALHYWIEEHYGIRMGIDDQGNYTQDYQIVDPKRYMMFQLKYWK